MRVELVVFDMAGTTVVNNGHVVRAFTDAFSLAGIEVVEQDINAVMGYKKMEAIEVLIDRYLPDFDGSRKDIIEYIHEVFTRRVIMLYEEDTALQPLPYTKELFTLLQERSVKVALNTGFTRIIADTILVRLGWQSSPLINTTIASDEVSRGRPYPYMIQTIMQRLGIKEAGSVIKVGDTPVDVKEGRNVPCGMVVSVTTGAYTKGQLERYHPDHIISSLQELPALIQ